MAVTDRDKALETAVAQIDKQYGKGSIMRLGDETRAPVSVIPSGSVALDLALGVGGLPRGRVVEIYGPESSGKTTVALHAVANAQAGDGICAFIDAEHALDPVYAERLGVDTDSLLVSQPDNGEQALEIADMLIRSGALDLVVVDSVAALTPRAEIEGEMGDSHVGLQARLMSQALRKMTSALSASGTTAIFINQLREKIGVMFGCFSSGTRVQLADGSTEKIGTIVNQKLPVEVLSYDAATNRIVPRRVVNWFDNGVADEFLQFTVGRSGGNGRSHFAATGNHLVRTPGGWRHAGELSPGDRVLVNEPKRLSDQQLQVVLGSLLGDGSISPNRHGRNGVRFRMGHGAVQQEYLQWKTSLLDNIGHSWHTDDRSARFVDFTPLPELSELHDAVYIGDRKVISDEYLKALTPLALAIWYADDGSFAPRSKGLQQRTRGASGRIEIRVDAFSEGSRIRMRDYLRDTHGLDVRLSHRGRRQVAVLRFSTGATAKFQQLVAGFLPAAMDDKFLERFRGQGEAQPEFVEARQFLMPAQVLDVHSEPATRSMHKFDIEVEGQHNYFADGTMVHNSPETTTGGKALKFYASVRLDVRRIETLKDGQDMVGNRTRVKVVKNKCLAEGTRVFDPVSGLTHRIEEVVDNRLPIHLAATDKKGRLETRPVVSWFDQGEQDVIGLQVQGGAEIWVTGDHQILTDRGWTEAANLSAGDRVARPREVVGAVDGRLRESQDGYLASDQTEPVFSHLQNLGVTPRFVANVVGMPESRVSGGLRQILGSGRLRRGQITALADALDDQFLSEQVADQLSFHTVREILPARRARTFDLEVEELHNLVAEDVVVHNCAPPFKQAEFDILYGRGISREGSLLDMGVDTGLVRKAGAWFTYEADQLGQGKENARAYLQNNPDVANELETKIKQKLGIGQPAGVPDGVDPTTGEVEF
jgi:recombination protein RecA